MGRSKRSAAKRSAGKRSAGKRSTTKRVSGGSNRRFKRGIELPTRSVKSKRTSKPRRVRYRSSLDWNEAINNYAPYKPNDTSDLLKHLIQEKNRDPSKEFNDQRDTLIHLLETHESIKKNVSGILGIEKHVCLTQKCTYYSFDNPFENVGEMHNYLRNLERLQNMLTTESRDDLTKKHVAQQIEHRLH